MDFVFPDDWTRSQAKDQEGQTRVTWPSKTKFLQKK
jgi:hypothetical protein